MSKIVKTANAATTNLLTTALFAITLLTSSTALSALTPSAKTEKPAIGCNELATVFQTEMTVPYKAIADKRVRRCVQKQTVNSVNMPLYIATAFYDQNLNERVRAFNKLKSYSCENENTCKKLFSFIDAHLKATILTKTVDSRDLFSQLDSFRDQLHYELNR